RPRGARRLCVRPGAARSREALALDEPAARWLRRVILVAIDDDDARASRVPAVRRTVVRVVAVVAETVPVAAVGIVAERVVRVVHPFTYGIVPLVCLLPGCSGDRESLRVRECNDRVDDVAVHT